MKIPKTSVASAPPVAEQPSEVPTSAESGLGLVLLPTDALTFAKEQEAWMKALESGEYCEPPQFFRLQYTLKSAAAPGNNSSPELLKFLNSQRSKLPGSNV